MIPKPGVGIWNLPLNQQPQVNPLQLVSESMMNSLRTLGSLPSPQIPQRPQGHPGVWAGRVLSPGRGDWASQVWPRHLHPQPVPPDGQVGGWREQHDPLLVG